MDEYVRVHKIRDRSSTSFMRVLLSIDMDLTFEDIDYLQSGKTGEYLFDRFKHHISYYEILDKLEEERRAVNQSLPPSVPSSLSGSSSL